MTSPCTTIVVAPHRARRKLSIHSASAGQHVLIGNCIKFSIEYPLTFSPEKRSGPLYRIGNRKAGFYTSCSLTPSQHSTPRKCEKGGTVFAPFVPGRRQVSQLVDRCNPSSGDSNLQLRISALDRAVVAKATHSVGRSITYVNGRRLDSPKPGFLK